MMRFSFTWRAVAIVAGGLVGAANAQEPRPRDAPKPLATAAVAPKATGTAATKGAVPSATNVVPGSANPHGAAPAQQGQLDDGDNHEGHGHAQGQRGDGQNGMEPPPEDIADEDVSLPPGTIAGVVLDENEKPFPNAIISIGVVKNTVAKGESREKIVRTTDAQGALRLDDLSHETGTAYRITTGRDGATYAAPPFRLPEKHGVRFKLHTYPSTKNVDEALIVTQSFVVIEIKDDRIQMQQLFGIWNFGKKAWIADTVIPFPSGFTGFAADQGMSDVGVDLVEKVGVRLRGTIGPGQHNVEFRWQLPYDGETDITVEAPMPPHLAAARVIVPASLQMKVKVDGFDDPKINVSEQGQRAYQTDRQFTRDEKPLATVRVLLSDLPQSGASKYVKFGVTGLSLGCVAFGLVVFATRRREQDAEERKDAHRDRLLEQLKELELAKKAGEVGPKTYEREHRELIDQLAATYVGSAAA